jgi:hypothetical protein
MKKFIATTFIAALALTAAPAFAAPAAIETAKAQCIVGEQTDGYLGVIDNAKADEALRREVRSVNQQRKAAYAELAARNGVTIEQAAQVTAERLLNQAPSGHCIQTPEGGWVKKP